jgi:hypothetical protein
MRFKPFNCKRLQGAADARRRVRRRPFDLLYFKCPTTKQMRCPVNAYVFSVPIDLPGLNAAKRTRGGRIVALRQIEVDDATGDLDVFDIFQEQAQDLNLPEALIR